ncbi:hypothetical protein F4703DRAFT_1903277 [Phycomyces blakesleeanus]
MLLSKSLLLFTATFGLVFVSNVHGVKMSSIEECPALKPRTTAPKGVTDLRPDDITVIGAIGDSITAGFAADGIQGDSLLNLKSIYEYRGVSYAAGGDPGAITIPNLIKRYSPKLLGPSVKEHLVELCFGPLCAPNQYKPSMDVLNAAQSGAMAPNLDDQVDYLLPAIKNLPGVNYTHDWKLINIQIGSNDQCTYCLDPVFQSLGAKSYGENVVAAIERIRTTVPRVLINLMSTFKVSQVYTLTAQQEYCMPFKDINFKLNTFECMCSINPKKRPQMDEISDAYNAQLLKIFNDYKSKSTDSFGVMYTPVPVNITSFPIDGLSDIDCFHPSTKGHQWVTKVYCPTETDRIGS